VPTAGVALLVTAARFTDMRSPDAVEERLAKVQADAEAKMGRVTHRIVTRSFERPASVLRAAPPSIYPVDTDLAAMIVSGEMLLLVEVSVDAVVAHLADAGVDAEIVLPEDNRDLSSGEPMLRWRSSDGGGVIHVGVMTDLAMDLADLAVWARAFAQSPTPPGKDRWGGYLCLADEGKVWLPRV
jgi:hypothetical protein